MITLAIFVTFCVGYGTCKPQNFVFVNEPPPQNSYPFGWPTTSNVHQNVYVNDEIFFVNPAPSYQVTDVPRPVTVSKPISTQNVRPASPQIIRPVPTRPQLVPTQPSLPPPQNSQFPTNSINAIPPVNNPFSNKSEISEGIYNLGQQILFRAIDNHGRQSFKSEVISPLSIAGVTYLLYLGAAGDTEKELATLLGLNRGTNQNIIHQQFGQLLDEIVNDREMRNEDKKYPEQTENRVHQISVANALFLNQNFPLRVQYESAAHNTYKSEVRRMNFAGEGFQAKRYIDHWVSSKTHGKIPMILPQAPTGNTQMIVVSALYFKALWWEELGVLRVYPLPFYPDGEQKAAVTVNTIIFASEILPYYRSTELNCQIIGLKYQKQLSTMYIVQPLVSNREAVKTLQSLLTAEMLDYLIGRMQPTYVSLLTVPKFHLQNDINLKSIFQEMGVRTLFGRANLTPITPNRNELQTQPSLGYRSDLEYLDAVRKSNQIGSDVSISQIYHKVDLVVNEKGTEGGAATAAYVDKIAGKSIKVNSPFLFVVRQDLTRLPLFYGVIFEPEQD